MVLIKVLGLLDAYSAIMMILFHYDFIGWRLLFGALAWLAFKAYTYKGDVASFFDMLCGFYILLMMFGFSNGLITWLFVIYLGQKAVVSLM